MRVKIDSTRCEGYGMCADVLPDVFKLDEWGYAYVESSGDVPADLEDLARHAIRSCPTDAISELDLTD